MEKYLRNPNTICSICQQPIYRRPFQLKKGNVYCSLNCSHVNQRIWKSCIVCGAKILTGFNRKTCSRACSNKNRSGKSYTKDKANNQSQYRLKLLKDQFDFNTCMIDGCNYDKIYDVHRYIPGKLGGEYIIGNMFAICPMHHAEVSRGIIELIKINDHELRIVNSCISG